MSFPIVKTDAEWNQILASKGGDSKLAFDVLFKADTEAPGKGEYTEKFYPKGHFACRACDQPLYSAESKFKAHCGWPAFDKYYKGTIVTKDDFSMFNRKRTEIMCSQCGGHLGHVFNGEGYTETDERHCVNSISVVYKEEDPKLEQVVYKKK